MRRLVAALAAFSATAALADLTAVTETKTGPLVVRASLSAKGGRVLTELEQPGQAGSRRTVLRDGAAGKTWIIDHAKKTVLEVEDARLNEAAARQAEFEAQVRARLAGLPEAERAKAEAALAKPSTPPAPASTSTRRRATPAR